MSRERQAWIGKVLWIFLAIIAGLLFFWFVMLKLVAKPIAL